MFTPETADFLEIHLPEPLRKLCNLQTLLLEPLVLLKKVYALTTRMFCGPWKPATSEGYIHCVIEHQSSAKEYGFSANIFSACRHAASRIKAMTEFRWWCHCCFIMAKPRPNRTHSTGWMSLTIRNLPGSCTPKLFRWWISPSYLTTDHATSAYSSLELIQKHIRDRI